MHARRAVNSVLGECSFGKRRSVKPAPQLMVSLTSKRFMSGDHPFAVTGLDNFGSIVIIFWRKVNRYGVIFTCLNARAVHF